MVNPRNIPENLTEKYLLFFDTILDAINCIESNKGKINYFNRIIQDCDSIIELCELFDQEDIDSEYINTLKLEINRNFDWLLDKSKKGPPTRPTKLKESESYYLNADQVNSIGKEIVSTLAGLNDLKIAFKIELEKYEDSESRKDEVKDMARIRIKSSITDIVRIFEAMKEAEIISSGKTEVKQIAEIFFNEPLEQKKFEALYNARKSEITSLQRSSNSKELEKFIKVLIECCFGNKDKVLEEIVKHIEVLQKKHRY